MAFPFHSRGLRIVDSKGVECALYPDVLEILQGFASRNVPMGIASRVANIAGAYLLLHLFKIRQYFWPIEIYPTSKTLHFQQIKKKTGLEYEDMIFFDDDKRNLKDLIKLKLPCVHVPKGLQLDTIKAIEDGKLRFRDIIRQ